MKSNRDKNNTSTISFRQFAQPQVQPQRNRIYVSHSAVSQCMKDKSERQMKTQTKFYQNKIFNSSQKYEVSANNQDYKDQKQNHRNYLDFLNSKQKFVKPYGQNTKFSDLVNKNQALLRRGQFQTPLTDLRPVKMAKKNRNNRIFKYIRHSTKPTFFEEKQPYQSTNLLKRNHFDKTLSTEWTVFSTLYHKERSKKSEWIGLHNSMNRLIGAQSIGLLINPRSKTRTVDQ